MGKKKSDKYAYFFPHRIDLVFFSEVNLKIKQALPVTAAMVSPAQLAIFEGIIESEQPNNRLYNYDGTLTTKDEDGHTRRFPLDPNMLLLRGAQLRNTSWIYGIVIFTGHETKLMLNSSKKPTKASNVTRKTNRNILYLFTMLVIMSVLCSIGNYVTSVSVWAHLVFNTLTPF